MNICSACLVKDCNKRIDEVHVCLDFKPEDKTYYKHGYKNILERDRWIKLSFAPKRDIITKHFHIYKTGWLVIFAGYAWDGCSGPTWDDDTNFTAGLVHDVLCQAGRMGLLVDSGIDRPMINKEFHIILLSRGMNRIRAWYYWKGSGISKKASEPGYDPYPVRVAP